MMMVMMVVVVVVMMVEVYRLGYTCGVLLHQTLGLRLGYTIDPFFPWPPRLFVHLLTQLLKLSRPSCWSGSGSTFLLSPLFLHHRRDFKGQGTDERGEIAR